MNYRVFETDQFTADLDEIEKHFRIVKQKLNEYVYPQLKTNPYFGKNIKKLKGFQPEMWRYRIGNYRFFYEIDRQEKIVFMLAVEHRKDCY